MIITNPKWSLIRKRILKHLLDISYMKMQFIVEVNVMHVKGLATQLAQVGLINPIKLIDV